MVEEKDAQRIDKNEYDLIISLGGDGALLKASQLALKHDKPIFGINSGRLGYLCAMDYKDLENFTEIYNNCLINERILLEIKYHDNHYYALNDIVFGKENFGVTITITSVIDNIEETMRGDGLIISTPTGSSAYNKAAGGQLLDINSPLFIVTPICPCNGYEGSIIDNNEVVSVYSNKGNTRIFVDGIDIGLLDERVSVYKSKKTIKLYRNK